MSRSVDISAVGKLKDLFEQMPEFADGIASQALWEGAKLMADAVFNEVKNLETEPFRHAGPDDPRLVSPQEKGALIKTAKIHGIAKFSKTAGEVSTAVGINPDGGYCSVRGAKTPVPVLVRSINSGTTFRIKQPFMRRAITRNRAACAQTIESELNRRTASALDDLLGGK